MRRDEREFIDFAESVLAEVVTGEPSTAMVFTDNMRKREIAAVIQEVGRRPEFGVEFAFDLNRYGDIIAEEIIPAPDFTTMRRMPGATSMPRKITFSIDVDNLYPDRDKFEDDRKKIADDVTQILKNRMKKGGRRE